MVANLNSIRKRLPFQSSFRHVWIGLALAWYGFRVSGPGRRIIRQAVR